MKPLVIEAADTIRQKVYNHVREQILRGSIAPGERLIETSIASEIGTSRTPVREALHALEREGLIESRPRVGYTVKPVSAAEVEEICAIRAAVETLAASWAIRKSPKKVLSELKRNVALTQERLDQARFSDFIDLDAQFHEIIARASGSDRILELAQTLRSHMLRYRVQSIYSAGNVIEAIAGHTRIIAALESGDADGIKRAVETHMEESKNAIIHYVFKEAAPGGAEQA
ncbi:MAG: GntR family transcriptional regulator [Deltaproteobacteria bacterium]|nr:GntR family transcriptional regulator [Deltaproteobacteria bacterium]